MAVVALKDHCNVTCFERANNIGGQWAADTDAYTKKHYGTRQSSLYKGLWCNAPKEAGVEVANYPWKPTKPSFVPGDDIKAYLMGYADHFRAKDYIHTCTSVEKVYWDAKMSKFAVTTKNADTNKQTTGNFDYVCVATGHFHYPNNPTWKGQETFSGTLIHSHDFTGCEDFANKRILCVGGSYSAEDIVQLTKRNGSKFSHISSRKKLPYKAWPAGVVAKPILTEISGSKVTFKDGSAEEYDVIINCTGFVHKFPFLTDALQPGMVGNAFVPNGLYEQCISVNNPNLFFIGMQNLAWTNPMFQLQSFLIRDVITGKFRVPDKKGREAGLKEDLAKQAKFKSAFDAIGFQADYVNHLADLTGGPHAGNSKHIWISWVHDKLKSIIHFRENNYASIYTGLKGGAQADSVEDAQDYVCGW